MENRGKGRIGFVDEHGRTCCVCRLYKKWIEFCKNGSSKPNKCLQCRRNGREFPLRQKNSLRELNLKEYGAWANMKSRCLRPETKGFKYWGGRGIKICEGLLDFATFLSVLGRRPDGLTLDRADNNKHYSCGSCENCKREGWQLNVRWASRVVQANNQRRGADYPLYTHLFQPQS